CLLNFFSRLRVTGFWKKFVRFFAPATFGVYLIHCEPLIRAHGNYPALSGLLVLPPPILVPAVLGVAAGIWLACSLLDRLRLALFQFLGVRERCIRLEERLRARLSA
ncbi:MAG: hypothetical protein IJT94_17680, partial [Oscillibacter sp.]|nr:hypothetical protein [Oscillibacter sp.]